MVLNPGEKKIYTLMQQINTLRNEKDRIRDEKKKEKDVVRQRAKAKEEVRFILTPPKKFPPWLFFCGMLTCPIYGWVNFFLDPSGGSAGPRAGEKEAIHGKEAGTRQQGRRYVETGPCTDTWPVCVAAYPSALPCSFCRPCGPVHLLIVLT